MKTIQFVNPLFILVLILISCNDEEELEPSFDYIKFTVEGNSYIFRNEYDPLWNTYFRDANQDQLGLIMQDEKEEALVQLFLTDSDFLNKDLPIIVDQESYALNEGFAEMSLISLITPTEVTFGENDSINYVNHSLDDFIFIIDSYEHSVLRGKFYGVLKTKTGKRKEISSGNFKITLKIKES